MKLGIVILISFCLPAFAQVPMPSVIARAIVAGRTNAVPLPAKTNIVLTITPTNYFGPINIEISTNLQSWKLLAIMTNDQITLPIGRRPRFFRAGIAAMPVAVRWEQNDRAAGIIIFAQNGRNGRPFSAMWDIQGQTNLANVALSDPDRFTIFYGEFYDADGVLSVASNMAKFKMEPAILSITAQ